MNDTLYILEIVLHAAEVIAWATVVFLLFRERKKQKKDKK